MTGNNKLIALGDLTILLKQTGTEQNGFPVTYESDLSGASALVGGCVAALGGRSKCIGKLGQDLLGEQLLKMLESLNIETDAIEQVNQKNTALTVISDNENKNSVTYRKESANDLLKMDDMSPDLFNKGDILFYSSNAMIDSASRSAVEKAIKLAGQNGTLIIYAPLTENHHWVNDKMARETILHTIPHTHFMILTQAELEFLTELQEEHLAMKKLFSGKMKGLIILKPSGRLTYMTAQDKGRLSVPFDLTSASTAIKEIFTGTLIAKWLENSYDMMTIHSLFADPDLFEDELMEALEKAAKATEVTGAYHSLKRLM